MFADADSHTDAGLGLQTRKLIHGKQEDVDTTNEILLYVLGKIDTWFLPA